MRSRRASPPGSTSRGVTTASGLPPPQDLLLLEETQCQSAASPPLCSRLSCWCWAWSPQDAAATTIRAPVIPARPSPRPRPTPSTPPRAKTIKVGLVTDIGGLNDRSFNQLANEGLEKAKSDLGVDGRVLTSKSNADYVPNLSTLAQQKYDLVIGVGFLMSDAMNTVATKFPDTQFAIIDFSQAALKAKPTNVRGLLFAEQEPGYVVGYIAGLYTKDKGGKQVISSVGGQKI